MSHLPVIPVIEVDGHPCYNLQDVADRVYGDATKWKAIAAANGIDHPANIPMSVTHLTIPDVEDPEDEES